MPNITNQSGAVKRSTNCRYAEHLMKAKWTLIEDDSKQPAYYIIMYALHYTISHQHSSNYVP